MNREEFELLPKIRDLLKDGNIEYDPKSNRYFTVFSTIHAAAMYVDGAWYAWQEVQYHGC